MVIIASPWVDNFPLGEEISASKLSATIWIKPALESEIPWTLVSVQEAWAADFLNLTTCATDPQLFFNLVLEVQGQSVGQWPYL